MRGGAIEQYCIIRSRIGGGDVIWNIALGFHLVSLPADVKLEMFSLLDRLFCNIILCRIIWYEGSKSKWVPKVLYLQSLYLAIKTWKKCVKHLVVTK